MNYIVICVVFSVAVSIFLKMARKSNIQVDQAIAINYLVAASLCFGLFRPDVSGLSKYTASWPIFVALGVLLPTVFIWMAQAVRYAGIVKSDAAQRLALFLPIMAAFLIFGEVLTQARIAGLGLAFVALVCLLFKPNIGKQNGSSAQVAMSLLGVWLGYGVIDILFKQLAKSGSATAGNLLIAFILSALLIFTYLLLKRTQWSAKSMLSGIVLGGLNFGNIWYYIKSHQAMSENPTLVFAGVNIGVITLGTLAGVLLFREKLSKINVLGVLIAISSIVVLFYLDKIMALLA